MSIQFGQKDGFIVINLREINADNWRVLTKLKVKDWQAPFVASNGDSIARAHYVKDNFPLGIYDDETPVGFCMYSISPKRRNLDT